MALTYTGLDGRQRVLPGPVTYAMVPVGAWFSFQEGHWAVKTGSDHNDVSVIYDRGGCYTWSCYTGAAWFVLP